MTSSSPFATLISIKERRQNTKKCGLIRMYMFQEVTKGYRGLHGVTKGYNGLKGVTRSYRGYKEVKTGYKGLQEVTRG